MWTQCWLNYEDSKKNAERYRNYFSQINICGFEESKLKSSIDEISMAVNKWYFSYCESGKEAGENLKIKILSDGSDAQNSSGGIIFERTSDDLLGREGYRLRVLEEEIRIYAEAEAGIMYGVYRMLSLMSRGSLEPGAELKKIPDNSLRMLDHWDNMDGSIERGYSGNSFFFKDNRVIINDRTLDYARLIASIGINAVAINNVNVKDAACDLINDRYLSQVNRLADLFSDYNISLFLCINFAAPLDQGIGSADPLDERVCDWWQEKVKEVYSKAPKLGGFLVKADSEGRPGPMTYKRTQADGANMLAKVVEPFKGKIIWRCFVYNCCQDWRDLSVDRAKAGYDYFSGLDGDFNENVILQIKNGPMDFQVREPVSPLFGGMKRTNQMLEVQIAQEYTGHQIDVCYLIPWFKEILEYNTYLNGKNNSSVADIISGRAIKDMKGGIAAVSNTGDDDNWTGNTLAAANLFGFGRLAFDTGADARDIAEEWAELTFPELDEKGIKTVVDILMNSWPTYEKYTSPLGIGWMVKPNDHYGPSIDGYEYDRWGTYHRADFEAIGVERGPEGTGYSLQYLEPNRSMYAKPETTPEELLLFFHRMPYKYVLKTGKTIIQHIYDTHFEGYENVLKMQKEWCTLKGRIPENIYENVAERFELQVSNAKEWCDIVNSYFYRKCGIKDEMGRKIY